jgi:hypothetical protein
MRLKTLLEALLVSGFVLCATTAVAYDADFDYNGDGVVDQLDIDMLAEHFMSAEGDEDYDPIFDHDGNGLIAGADWVATIRAASE